jgi:GNAT superfamily N-acetyltransferase
MSAGAPLRRLVRRLQSAGTWRRFGRRVVVPRLRIVSVADEPAAPWRHVYPDIAHRADPERALAGVHLALAGRRAVGGMLLHPCEEGLLLSAMRVRPLLRGLGIGALLLDRALAIARAQDRPVVLVVHRDNRPAVHLYRSRGFVPFTSTADWLQPGHLALRSP